MNQSPLSPSKIKVLICASSTRSQPLMIETLEKQMRGQAAFDLLRVEQVADLAPAMKETPGSLILFSLPDKDALLPILGFLSQVQESISSGIVRVIVISAMNHPKVISLLRAKGVFDVLDLQTGLKSANLKIKNALFMIMRSVQQQQKNESALVLGASKSRSESHSVVWEKSEEHPEDFWLVTDKKNARFLMGRWLVDVLGPGTSAGIWKASELKYKNDYGWEWCHRPGGDMRFHSEKGRWVFFGKLPEFVWEKNTWAFFGKYARLSFYSTANEVLFDRFLLDPIQETQFKVFENSETAKSLVSVIQSTIDLSVKTNDREDYSELEQVSSISSSRSGQKKPSNLQHTPVSNGFDPLWDLGDLTDLPIDQGHRTFETMSFEIRITSHQGNILGRPPVVQIVDLLGASAFLEVPSGDFALGDQIVVEATLTREGEKEHFEAKAVIRSLEEISPKKVLVSCEMDPKEVEQLEQVFNVFTKRQERLMDFFDLAKGA